MKPSVFLFVSAACLAPAFAISPFSARQLSAPKEPKAMSWKFIDELKQPEKNPGPMPGSRPGDLKSPWLINRISRCYFSPIKRAPYWRDELTDDVDYYPDAYLARLRNEGVNGLWLSGKFRELAETSFTKRDPNGLKRLKKLARVVEKCKRYGIKIWLFGIEPVCLKPGDTLLRDHPEFAGSRASWIDWRMMCSSVPGVRQYLEESTYDIFRHVPDLAGLLLITSGEGMMTCLSCRHITGEEQYPEHFTCERCRDRPNWELHTETVTAMLKGMRRVNPKAELLSWFYHPETTPHRLEWVRDAARNLPEGVSLIYNFESGGLKRQAGRWRCGGDYWLSYPGPGLPFTGVANAAKEAGTRIGAKIQTANSHECATVPYIPAPGLLYRKMKAMHAAGVSDVMMCWFFGNYPGIMNRTIGKLAYSDFKESEAEFLKHLATETWGEDGAVMGRLWEDFTAGFSCYPFSNVMQYYGPFHNGIAWPLISYVELGRMSHTWIPGEPPSGDLVGEALSEFTIDEVIMQAEEMASKCSALDENGVDLLEQLSVKYAGNRDRLLDIGVMKTLRALFRSGHDIFRFYRLRSEAIAASRIRRDRDAARAALSEMRAIAARAKALTEEVLPLTREDSRLGFHSEAQDYKFWPELLEWRIAQMDVTMSELAEIDAALSRGEGYPESEIEKTAPKVFVDGKDIVASNVVFRLCRTKSGDLEVRGKASASRKHVVVGTFDAAGVSYPVHVFVPRPDLKERVVTFPAGTDAATGSASVNPDGSWNFLVRYRKAAWNGDDRLRPGWIALIDDDFPQTHHPEWIWPVSDMIPKTRLCIPWFLARGYGRICW